MSRERAARVKGRGDTAGLQSNCLESFRIGADARALLDEVFGKGSRSPVPQGCVALLPVLSVPPPPAVCRSAMRFSICAT